MYEISSHKRKWGEIEAKGKKIVYKRQIEYGTFN